MADVMDMPAEAMDRRREHKRGRAQPGDSPPPPPTRRDKELQRDRRDEYRDSRNRSPGLPLPPPPPGGPSSRGDREYRRRSSPSPPPYRDRRHSPPRRSPPPGHFKRPRRDNGGYEKRRGSPRGGFDERRLSYDYVGGYDRGGPGGRLGYVDDRMQGRYRSSEYPESGRATLRDGGQREGLMSYKQFIQELEDDILPAEAERRYQEYRSEYIATQKRTFFEAHKEEEWLKDKYHPTNVVSVIERRNEQAKTVAKELLLDLHSDSLDTGPGLTAASSLVNSEDEGDVGGKRRGRHVRGAAKENDPATSAPKAHPVCSEPRRIQSDVDLAQSLVRKLDAEKGVVDNVLSSRSSEKSDYEKSTLSGSMGPIVIIRGLTSVKGLEGAELLDTLLTYLWRVHGVDYYGMVETSEPKGLRHVRVEVKNFDLTGPAAAEWEKKLEGFWQGRLAGSDPLEARAAKEKIDAVAGESLDPLVRKIRDEKYGWKYGCGAKGCTKLFHGAEFVHKHLKLKHPELVLELTVKLREDLYFQNYMNDPDAPGGTPVMQQPAPSRDWVQRPRRRDHDRAEQESDDSRLNRSENSPPPEFPGRNGDGVNGDEGRFDSFAGPGLHGGPPFPSDIAPPPVLMPVPGAGPLGPFVPAPPEVAMRMLREGGPPLPFDGGARGRNRPPMPGPGQILGVPPPFRQDPRRLRSYQDLDAPEDEVTVIDYRSL
ncbi:C2H2 zinc-finger protein SERRATE (SE) [Wolffia australiana]